LDVREVTLDKKTATIRLGTKRVPGQPGEQHTARVSLTTNGRVKHMVTVRLTVQPGVYGPVPAPPVPVPNNPFAFNAPSPPPFVPAPPSPAPAANPFAFDLPAPPPAFVPPPPAPAPMFTAPPPPPLGPSGMPMLPASGPPMVTPSLPPPPPRRPPERPDDDRPVEAEPVRPLAIWAPVVILLLGLMVPVVRDIIDFATHKPVEKKKGPNFGAEDEDTSDYPEKLTIHFHTTDSPVKLAVGGAIKPGGDVVGPTTEANWPATMRFGLTVNGGGQLTYSSGGMTAWTNNCVVQIDGASRIFGDSGWHLPAGGTIGPVRTGKWEVKSEEAKGLKQGTRSVWLWDDVGIRVTQTVSLVPNLQSRAFDTCRVHYKIENTGTISRRVGLRFLLDTFIGTNDGVPFLLPGKKQLCSTTEEFNRPEDIPDFIQACEREGDDRGTVAHIGLRLAEPILDQPTRVTLGAYPSPGLSKFIADARRFKFQQEMTEWDVPVVPIKTLASNPDSAVVIYWDAKELAPGKSREMAFTYGLGQVTGKSKLALTAGGSFVVGGEFTVTAYIKDPRPDQKVTLILPEGFSLVDGDKEMDVPPLPRDGSTTISPVTWRVKAGGEGTHTIKVRTSDDLEQQQKLKITAKGIFGKVKRP
jgi:hypothetical protein